MTSNLRSIAPAALTLLLFGLAGCGDWLGGNRDKPLPEERIEVLRGGSAITADRRVADLDVLLPKPEVNDDWPQAGGYPNHAMHHLAASGSLNQLWRSDIGEGSDDEAQLISGPVVSAGRIYSLDIEARVSAFNANTGQWLWDVELSRDSDDQGMLGGGLAVEGNRLFATTGFADVVALDATTGKEIWRKRINGPMRAPPTVWAGRVFVVTVSNDLFALSAEDGRELWTHSGLREVAGLVGAAPAAVEGGIIVVPYSSGEVVALRVENGRQVWTETLTALRRADAVSSISHIRGRPVIDRGIVYVVGHSNRTVAVDLRTGTRLWEVPIGGRNGPWTAGNFIYVLTRDAELVCLTRRGGRVRWVAQLPRFEDEEDQEDPIQWTGPVLAGDRLLIAGSHEEIWSVSPYSGKVLGRIDVSAPVRLPPIVAKETVYILTEEADLIALR